MAGWHHWCNGHKLGQALGDVEGQGGLVCCIPWSRKELEVTGWLNNSNSDPGCCSHNPATKWLLDSLFQYFFIHSTCIEHQLHSKLLKKKKSVLGLHWCRQAFSSCGKLGVLYCRARALDCTQWYMELSCTVAYGIVSEQGSNLCLLHWQADSYPVDSQGSPIVFQVLI